MKTAETQDTSTAECMAHAAGERAKGYVDSGVSACNAVTEKAWQIGRNANGCVRENPWLAIGVAAGAGVLIGFLVGRRCES